MQKVKKTMSQDEIDHAIEHGYGNYDFDIYAWADRIEKTIPLIDPKAAEVTVCLQALGDPYGFDRELMWKYTKVCMYYARAPWSGDRDSQDNPFTKYGRELYTPPGVWLGNLSPAVRDALLEKHKADLCAAALAIDPETAEVEWEYTIAGDPYSFTASVDIDADVEIGGREFFAHAPNDYDLWVWFGDLPEAVRDALWKKHGLEELKDEE